MHQDILDYYAAPGRFTTVDERKLTSADIGEVVEVVQGLLVYDVVAKPFYGVDLTPAQAETIHERDTARLLAAARGVDSRPLSQPRPAAARVGARCHIYSRLTVALLRAAGVPARARCGFATYFRPGWLEDHWVAEYWNPAHAEWQTVDAQLDDTWRKMIGFDGNALAITGLEFVSAGHAWQAWRRGELDEGRCGLSAVSLMFAAVAYHCLESGIHSPIGRLPFNRPTRPRHYGRSTNTVLIGLQATCGSTSHH